MTLASQMRIQPLEPPWVRYLNQRLPGETPNINDEFFLDTTVWGTAVTISGTATWEQSFGCLSARVAGQSTGDAAGRYVTPASISAPLTLETRVTANATSGLETGIGLSNGVVGSSAMVSAAQVSLAGGLSQRAWFGQLDSMYGTTNTTIASTNAGMGGDPIYLRLVWVASNSFKVGFRRAQAPWTYSSLTPTITPTTIVLWGSTDSGADANWMTFDYLRVNAADLSV